MICGQVLDLVTLMIAYVAVAFHITKIFSVNDVMDKWRKDPKVGHFYLYMPTSPPVGTPTSRTGDSQQHTARVRRTTVLRRKWDHKPSPDI